MSNQSRIIIIILASREGDALAIAEPRTSR